MGDVAKLKLVERAPAGKPQPQLEVIAYIETLLVRARAGGIQAIAAAFVSPDGAPCTGWSRGDGKSLAYLLLTAATCLEHELVDGLNKTTIDLPPPSEEPA